MTRILPAMLVVAVVACAQPSAAFAQCPDTRASRPLFLAGFRSDKPLRETGSAGILIPVWDLDYGDPGCGVPAYRGLLVEASAGMGGRRVAVGLARRIKAHGQPALFGEDVLVSMVQTTTAPRGASPDSTYLGVEAGLMFVAIRFSVGVAHRLGSEGPNATIFIWSIGPQIVW